MDLEIVKKLLYLGVEKVVENLEKLTTKEPKDDIEEIVEWTKKKETKETKDAMLVGMAMNDDLPPVVIEQIHTMPPFKETSGEVGYKVKKMVEISNKEMERMKNKLGKNDNKERKSKYNKDYYEKHKEKIKEQQKKYYKKKQEQKEQEQKELEQKFNNLGNFSLLP